ncbi:MAG: polyamine aminopropyltransferase [Proteobacteria bacterium]|nr:MAG: polyamine aminopropyltransferase [Pseudomonadota bacterium]
MNKPEWIAETLTPGVRVAYQADRVLAQTRTEYQRLELLDNGPFGRMLVLDGAIQTTTRDEFIYHEMLAHAPLLAHGKAEDVLIVGGGDCGLAEEVLRHKSVRSLVQIEIDSQVVALAREHLSEINAAAFADPRFDLRIADGAQALKEMDRSFDVVLVDSTDPVGAAVPLFTREFYANVRQRLRPGGVVVVQAGVPFLQGREFKSAMGELTAVFQIVDAYLIASPSYFGGHLALGWASDQLAPDAVSLEDLRARYDAAGLSTRYYTPEMHKAAFVLPPFIRELMPAATTPQA